jgi:hypothetical protein
MPHRDLKNKPLVEATLEIQWQLREEPAAGLKTDPHYKMLLGRFYERFADPMKILYVASEVAPYSYVVVEGHEAAESGGRCADVGIDLANGPAVRVESPRVLADDAKAFHVLHAAVLRPDKAKRDSLVRSERALRDEIGSILFKKADELKKELAALGADYAEVGRVALYGKKKKSSKGSTKTKKKPRGLGATVIDEADPTANL